MKKLVETIGLVVLVLFVVIITLKSNSLKNKKAKSVELLQTSISLKVKA